MRPVVCSSPSAARALARATVASIALTAMVMLFGCAGASSPEHVIDPVAHAAELSLAPGAVRFSLRITGLADGLPISAIETGVADFMSPGRSMSEEVIDLAGQKQRLRVVHEGDVMYFAAAAQSGQMPSAPLRWYRRDLNQLFAQLGIHDQAEIQARELGLGKPFAALPFLAQLGTVQRKDATVVNGVRVTHYRVSIDERRVAKNGPVWMRQTAAYSLTQGVRVERLDIFIDSHGLVRREIVPLRTAANDLLDQPSYDASETIDFRNYSKPVPIPLPPARAVVDITASMISTFDAELRADRQLRAALSKPQRVLHFSKSAITFKYPAAFVLDATHASAGPGHGVIVLTLGARNAGEIQLKIDNGYHGGPAVASVRASVPRYDDAMRAAYGVPVHGVVETHAGLATIDYQQIARRRATNWFREAYVFVGTALYQFTCDATTWNDTAMTQVCANVLASLRLNTTGPRSVAPPSSLIALACRRLNAALKQLELLSSQLEHRTSVSKLGALNARLARLQRAITKPGLLNCALQRPSR